MTIESVDKLREALLDCVTKTGHVTEFDTYWITKDAADKLIDEIEREVAECYMELPVDADGVPVRIGDVMEFTYDPPQDQPIFEVSGFGAKGALFYVPKGEIRARKTTTASVVRHVKPRTLEDVLREFAGDYRRAMNAFEEGDEYGPSITELTAKCADEIRELMEVRDD